MRVLQAGAAGYLNKQAAPEEFAQAVKLVAAGGTYVSAAVTGELVTQLKRPSAVPHEALSSREFQVMQMLVAGKSIKAIAGELALSPKTVSTFHTRVLTKLRLESDVELVRYALEHHLLETPVISRGREVT